MMKKRASEKEKLHDWQVYLANISKATPIDFSENKIDQKLRILKQEKNFESWAKYYFPNFYTAEPASWHKRASIRVIEHPEWFEVRPWSRELAKSARTMMEVLFLCLTKKKRNVLMVSSTADNAERLLKPYRGILEANNRIIHDYGLQKSLTKWEEGEFVTKAGVAFRALGAGQSPRGTRNDEFRPDVILIDDIDTDEEVRNKERIKNKIKWIEEALIPTRSISGHLLIIVCGNIIGKYTVVTELRKKADYSKIVNIRDRFGRSMWPTKNSEEDIDRVLSLISHNAAQKEYFNNPQSDGDVFKSINYGTVPHIRHCEQVVVYADPATSNKTETASSSKALIILGYKNLQFFAYRLWVDRASNATFVNWMFEAHKYLQEKGVDTKRIYIENNSLQDPFFEQVILPLVYQQSKQVGFNLPITPDTRKKPDKFSRIEGTLEPLHRMGNLIFDIKLKGQTHMATFEDQWLAVSGTCKVMDGPDCLEGGVWIIQNRNINKAAIHIVGPTNNRKY
jgi:hypothetical protein